MWVKGWLISLFGMMLIWSAAPAPQHPVTAAISLATRVQRSPSSLMPFLPQMGLVTQPPVAGVTAPALRNPVRPLHAIRSHAARQRRAAHPLNGRIRVTWATPKLITTLLAILR